MSPCYTRVYNGSAAHAIHISNRAITLPSSNARLRPVPFRLASLSLSLFLFQIALRRIDEFHQPLPRGCQVKIPLEFDILPGNSK